MFRGVCFLSESDSGDGNDAVAAPRYISRACGERREVRHCCRVGASKVLVRPGPSPWDSGGTDSTRLPSGSFGEGP